MTEQELLDKGYGLWYIVLEHTNHRAVNASYEPWIYTDFDAVCEKADEINKNSKLLKHANNTPYAPMMVKEFNSLYKKHMLEVPNKYRERHIAELCGSDRDTR